MLNEENLKIIKEHPGFIAAMDQGDLTTPSTLRKYGIPDETYQTEEEMHMIVHDMRTRMVISPEFNAKYVLGVILYKDSLNRQIYGKDFPNYLWEEKEILPFLKIDQGLAPKQNGVQLMKDLTEYDELIEQAKKYPIIGLKTRSLIGAANEKGIKDIVKQQFDIAKKVYKDGFLPVIEPNIELHIPDKKQAEVYLKEELHQAIRALPKDMLITIKLTLPEEADFYHDLIEYPNVVRILASSSGLRQTEADRKLSENHDMIASFSRALTEGLSYEETEFEYDYHLKQTIHAIYDASEHKVD